MSSYDIPTAVSDEREFVNYYEALGVSPDLPFEKLCDEIEQQRLAWLSRSQKPGDDGDRARRSVKVAEQALAAFTSEDAREQYDLDLRRSKHRRADDDEQPAEIDWLARAWNYYFLGDDGAGRVAARYAREADPKNPQVFVVAAWMHVLSANANGIRSNSSDDTEIKQAKHDADEAYVLDELGTDTVDVHHVRGFVYYLLGNADQAISSYERALRAATDYEKPEVLARKAWAHEAVARGRGGNDRAAEHNRTLECALTGLSFPFDLSVQVVGWLTEAAARAITQIAEGKPTSQATLDEYRSMLGRLQTAKIPEEARAQLVPYLEAHISRVEQLITIDDRISQAERRARELAAVQDASGSMPSIPFISSAIGLIALFSGFGTRDAGTIFIIAGLLFIAFAAFRFYRRSSWKGERTAYSAAQAELAQLHGERPSLEGRKRSLMNPASFAFRLA